MKATVFVALISMSLIATAGIGAITAASDEPVGDVVITVYKINQTNPEAPPIPIKTFDGSGPMSVIVIGNEYDDSANIIKEDKDGITEYTFEDGSMAITKNGIQVPERKLCFGMGIDNCPYVYPGDEMPELTKIIEKNPELANVIGEGVLTVGTRKTPEKTDAPARTLFYKPAPISASDEPAVTATMCKINSDGTTPHRLKPLKAAVLCI